MVMKQCQKRAVFSKEANLNVLYTVIFSKATSQLNTTIMQSIQARQSLYELLYSAQVRHMNNDRRLNILLTGDGKFLNTKACGIC